MKNKNLSQELKDYLSELGKKGGQTTFKRRGKKYMQEIGRKGGRISKRGKARGLTNKK